VRRFTAVVSAIAIRLVSLSVAVPAWGGGCVGWPWEGFRR
jgi:hypothetical protein